MSTTHSMPRLLPAPGSSMLENASPSPTSPAAFSLHTPEAPATSLSHTQANTLACAVEASIEQQLQIAQSTVMVRGIGGGGGGGGWGMGGGGGGEEGRKGGREGRVVWR